MSSSQGKSKKSGNPLKKLVIEDAVFLQDEYEQDSSLNGPADKTSKTNKSKLYNNQSANVKMQPDSKRRQYIVIFSLILLIAIAGFLIYDDRQQSREIQEIMKKLTIKEKNNHQNDSLQLTENRLKSNQQERQITNNIKNQKQINNNNLHTQITNNYTQQSNDKSQNQSNSVAVELQKQQYNFVKNGVWLYSDQSMQHSTFWLNNSLSLIETHSKEKGLQIYRFNINSWQSYIDINRANRVGELIKKYKTLLNEKGRQSEDVIALQYTVVQILKLQILYHNGGVFIQQNLVMTSNLDWLDSIQTKPWANVKNKTAKPEVIGFHSQHFSSVPQKVNMDANEQADKYMVLYPSLNPYFIYATKGSNLIKDMLQQYYSLIATTQSMNDIFYQNSINIWDLKDKPPKQQLFYLSCQLAIRKKQKQNNNNNQQMTGIQGYHLASVNQNLGPNKINYVFNSNQFDKIYRHLSLMPLSQLQDQFGKILYCLYLQPASKFNALAEESIQKGKIMKDSFIYTYMLTEQQKQQKGVFELASVNTTTFQEWNSLPKQVWTYIETPLNQSSIFTQLWVQYVKSRLQKQNYTFTILNPQNVYHYISHPLLKKINKVLKNQKVTIYDETQLQLYCLAIILQQGGIWIDPLTLLTQNLDWLTNIQRDKYVWNKLTPLPQVLLNFQPHYGGAFDWIYNQQLDGTKQQWLLSFDRSFIAAQPKSKLIEQWLQQFLKNLITPFHLLQEKFQKNGIRTHMWISEHNKYLLVLDSLKSLLGQKQLQLSQKKINKTSVQQYGLWGLNGYMGELKLRQYTNYIYGQKMDNPFLWQYSHQYAQTLMGKIYYPVKIYHPMAETIQKMMQSGSQLPQKNQFHSQSILIKQILVNPENIVSSNGRMQLQTIRDLVYPMKDLGRIVWIYQEDDISKIKAITRQCYKNIQFFSKLNNFQVRYVNSTNYQQWLSSQQASQVQNYLANLTNRKDTQHSNLKDHFLKIKQKYIVLNLLKQNGGILVGRDMVLTESLAWLDQITNNSLINGDVDGTPQIVGFFSVGYSSKKEIINKRYIVKYPSFQQYFLAVGKKSQFITDFLTKFIQIIEHPQNVKQKVKQFSSQMHWLNGDDPNNNCFYLASQFALRQKQQQLDDMKADLLAIQYYGIYSLNSRFYPNKLTNYFNSLLDNERILFHLGNINFFELEEMTGPIRYFSHIPNQNGINQIAQSIQKDQNISFTQNSFLNRFLLLNEEITQIKNQLKPAINNSQWKTLPKKIWYYQPNGIKQTSIVKQILVALMHHHADKQGYQLNQINDQNAIDYIGDQKYRIIQELLKDQTNVDHKPFLYRLFILAQKGGIFIPSNAFVKNGFKWVQNIANFNKSLILNRFGQLPKALLLFDTLQGPLNNWHYDQKLQNRVGDVLSYTSDFMAAQENSQLINEWLQEYTSILYMSKSSINKYLTDCKVPQKRWTSNNNALMIVNDALTCVLEKKRKNMMRQNSGISQPSDYYKLWSMSQSLSVNKLIIHRKMDDMTDKFNPLLWQYTESDLNQLIGKTDQFLLLSDQIMKSFETKLNVWKNQEWGMQRSLLTQYLQDQIKSKIQLNDAKLEIQL